MLAAMTVDQPAATALTRLADAIATRDWTGLRALLSDRCVVTLLHTGETFDADGWVGFNRDYPGAWRFESDEVVGDGYRAVLRAHTVTGDDTWHVASFATTGEDGTITSLVEVWTDVVHPHPQRGRS